MLIVTDGNTEQPKLYKTEKSALNAVKKFLKEDMPQYGFVDSQNRFITTPLIITDIVIEKVTLYVEEELTI